jgi:hypothetical protein
MINLIQIANIVFSQIKFLNSWASRKIGQGWDFIYRKRNDLEIGELPQDLDVVKVWSPEINVFDLFKIGLFALFDDKFCRERIKRLWHFQI